MDWIILAITVVLLGAYLFLRRKGQIPAETAIAYLRQGVTVIDVRSEAEFSTGHLQGALNMPLPQIEELIAKQVPDKDQVLLVHCQSGARSEMAKNRLNALGYRRVYNLGSYSRAAHLAGRV
jgi:phage shock protein E